MALPPHLADLDRRLRARFEQAVEDLRRQYESRLRRAHDDALAGLGEIRPAVSSWLEEADAAELERGSQRGGARPALDALLAYARAFDRAPTQAGVLDALLGGALAFAARAALLLVRDTGLVGWSSAGFDGDPVGGRDLGWHEGPFERLRAGRGAERFGGEAARQLAERLGVAAPDEAVIVPLVLRDRIAAALYADATAPAAVELAALQLLTSAAAARIELLALGDRAWTPTLYLADESAGEPLALWSAAAAPAAAVSAELPAPASELEPAFEPSEAPTARLGSELPSLAAEPAPPAAEVWSPAPPLWAAEPAPEPPAEPEPLPAAPAADAGDDSLWGAEAASTAAETAGFAVEAEPSPPPPPPAVAVPPLGDATVRIPVVRPAPVPPPPAPDEPTVFGYGATQEIRAVPSPAPPAPAFTEDATVLSPRGVAPPAPPAPADLDQTDQTGVRLGRGTEVAPPPDVRGPGLAFSPGRSARASGDGALHDEAKRLARLLVSEIKLYNEEQVLEGRRNRDLYVRLKEDIDRSRQIYDERVHESVRQGTDYFQQELVRSLAGGDPRALGM